MQEQEIYINDLLKKIRNYWRSILIITLVFAIFMGIRGYRNLNDNYTYSSIFLVTNDDYENISDTLQLAQNVLTSRSVIQAVNATNEFPQVSAGVQISTQTNGTVTMSMSMDKNMAQYGGFEYYKFYYNTALETLLGKFPNFQITIIDEPYISESPFDKSFRNRQLLTFLAKTIGTGAVLGLIVSVFLTIIRILWNPKEYHKEQ